MSSFIAFCENSKCGTAFEVKNLIGGSGNATIHMTDTKVGPCPVCSSYGLIPNGIYQYANEAVTLLTGPETSVQVLQQVYELLKKAKSTTLNKEEILKEVEAVSPKTAEVLQQVPDTKTLLSWLTALIALIALAIQIHTSYFKSDDIEKQFLKYLLEENKELREQNKKITPYKRETPKIKRNDQCPCGSGKKFKHCCAMIV